jgi:hypothetical protein
MPGTTQGADAIMPDVPRLHQPRNAVSRDSVCEDTLNGKVIRILELFLAEVESIGDFSCMDLENSATRFRQAIEDQGAPSVSRILFKIILACRRDDPDGARKELMALGKIVQTGEKRSEEL